MSGKREFGDYQTPIDFAKKVCDYLRFEKHIQPSTILEPVFLLMLINIMALK